MDVHAPERRPRPASAPASPTSASRIAALSDRRVRMLVDRPPGRADRALEPRRALARHQRRARRSPRVTARLSSPSRCSPRWSRSASAPRARPSSPPARTPTRRFSTASDFNTRRRRPDRSRQRRCAPPVDARRRPPPPTAASPACASRRAPAGDEHLDRRLHRQRRAVHLRLRHDQGRRRAARRPRGRARRRRLHAHLRRREPPDRQHRAGHEPDRPGHAADGHHDLERRPRPTPAPASPRWRCSTARSGAWTTICARRAARFDTTALAGRPLRPALAGHRPRREHGDRRSSTHAGSTTPRRACR